MTDKRVKVPEGMIEAVRVALGHGSGLIDAIQMQIMLSSALQWLTENPIVPTDEQCDRIAAQTRAPNWEVIKNIIRIYIERFMFTEPEPEDPLADLVYEHPEVLKQSGVVGLLSHNDCVREAFRRGQQSMIRKDG